METLYYRFDEPLGIYSQESHQRLAKMVMAGFVRQEQAQIDVGFVESLGESSNLMSPMMDESRISSLVESDDSYMGYGLLTPRYDKANEFELGGIWYQVKRDGEEPAVLQSKNISFPRPALMSKHEGEQEVDQLMFQFDKSELESIARMLGKMTRRLQADRPSSMTEVEKPSYGWLQLIASAPVEKDVLYAIKAHSLDDLNLLFPKQAAPPQQRSSEQEANNQPEELQHISEWTEFISVADDLIKKEADPKQAVSHVNVQYDANDRVYYVKLLANYGQLYAAQVLGEDHTGHWQTQFFEVSSEEDEDSAGLNMVSHMWDKAAIISSLRSGEIINNDIYESNRVLAENSLRRNFENEAPGKLVHLNDLKRKRPAA